MTVRTISKSALPMTTRAVIKKLLNSGGGHLSFCAARLEDFDRADADAVFRELAHAQGLKVDEWIFALNVELADAELPLLEGARVDFTVTRKSRV